MRNKKALIAVSTAPVLVLAAGSLAQASNENDGGNETGAFVMPCSLDGVNPAHHPGFSAIPPSPPHIASSDREMVLGRCGLIVIANATHMPSNGAFASDVQMRCSNQLQRNCSSRRARATIGRLSSSAMLDTARFEASFETLSRRGDGVRLRAGLEQWGSPTLQAWTGTIL
jgi:hypothetical protein